jgi:nitrite reductase (cytochrome c-552)
MDRKIWKIYALVLGVTIVFTALLTALLVNIHTRVEEGKDPYPKRVEITDETEDPAIWGSNFPLEYDGYKRTVEEATTRFGGSEAMPRVPTTDDPRKNTTRSRLDEDKRLKTFWAGYSFAVDYRERRGHAYMLEDQMFTGRQKATAQPGTCLHCHASLYLPYKHHGGGDLIKGFEKMNQMPYAEARKLVNHPIACIDCHDPKTMDLRVTRPGFLEGIKALKASQGVKDYDVNRDATRAEMRSFVCGQCHVEYYFKGKEKRLTYPWFKGLKIDDIYAYYQEEKYKDFVHKLSGAEVLKAQHPEFELWNQGVHARSGVSCADCHMPYKRVGAMKISEHQVRSPLLSINRSCQPCHKFPEAELKARAEQIQERTFKLRDEAMTAAVALIGDLQKAVERKMPDEKLKAAREHQRKGQFYLDFIESENSMGFHAPQESTRILAEAIDSFRQGQVVLRDAGFRP